MVAEKKKAGRVVRSGDFQHMPARPNGPRLQIPNWKRFQHYRPERGTPSWVKLYRSLLENPAYGGLTLEERGFLSQLWLLGSEDPAFKGTLPNVSAIAWRLHMAPMEVERLLASVIAVGFVIDARDASGDLADCNHSATPEEEGEGEVEVEAEGKADLPARKRALSGFDPRLRLGLLDGFDRETVERYAQAERDLEALWTAEVEAFDYDRLLLFIQERFPEHLVDAAFLTAITGVPKALAQLEFVA